MEIVVFILGKHQRSYGLLRERSCCIIMAFYVNFVHINFQSASQ
jgi:hypothetical protein